MQTSYETCCYEPIPAGHEYVGMSCSLQKGHLGQHRAHAHHDPDKGLYCAWDSSSKQSYSGGATRSKMSERFDLVPYEGVAAGARRFAYGAGIHGDRNWENGGEDFALACVNHLLKHAHAFAVGHAQDDIEAIVCNAMMIAHFKSKGMLVPPYHLPFGV